MALLLELAGYGLVIAGCSQIALWLGFIAAGVALLLIAYALERAE